MRAFLKKSCVKNFYTMTGRFLWLVRLLVFGGDKNMIITEQDIEKAEQELLKISTPIKNLYNPDYYTVINQVLLTDDDTNMGIFRAFTYHDSLRFQLLVRENPCSDMINWIVDEIEHIIETNKRSMILLWYSQTNGFSNELLDRLGEYTDPYRFFMFRLEHDDILTDFDMKGLTSRHCTEDMIDTCIEIMEDVFTPFPDSPNNFRNDKERIAKDFLDDCGGATLFYKSDELIGFCGHQQGHFTEVVVCKEHQGKGYGEIMVRAVLKSVYEMGYDAELTTGHYNERAIALYKKVGFNIVYESMRITLPNLK